MSFAGPFGEAACRYCNTLQDLTEERRLARHTTSGTVLRCEGSGTYGHTQQQELEGLAFSAEPVTQLCPICNTVVIVTTIGLHPDIYRMNSHYRVDDQPSSGYCEATGALLKNLPQLVASLKPPTVEVRPGQTNSGSKPWVDVRGWLSN